MSHLFIVPAGYAVITHILDRAAGADIALCGWYPRSEYGVVTSAGRGTVCLMCRGAAERAELTPAP